MSMYKCSCMLFVSVVPPMRTPAITTTFGAQDSGSFLTISTCGLVFSPRTMVRWVAEGASDVPNHHLSKIPHIHSGPVRRQQDRIIFFGTVRRHSSFSPRDGADGGDGGPWRAVGGMVEVPNPSIYTVRPRALTPARLSAHTASSRGVTLKLNPACRYGT